MTVSISSRSFIGEGCTGPLKVSRLLPDSTRTLSTQRRCRNVSDGIVEQGVFLQAAAAQRRRAGGLDRRAGFFDRVEPELDFAFERGGHAHKRLYVLHRAGC